MLMNKINSAEKKQTRESVQRESATRRKEVTKSGTGSAKGKARASSVKIKSRNLLENANEDLSITEYENDENEDFSVSWLLFEDSQKVCSVRLNSSLHCMVKHTDCQCHWHKQ